MALSLVLFTGCLSLARPSKQQREEASARAEKWFAAHRSEVGKSTFLLFASDRPTSFEVSSRDGKCDYKFARPKMDSGLATGISDDGYLLTAAHVVEEHCYVVGWMDGQPTVSPARVVYKWFGGEAGEELAILHVGRHLDCPIKLGTLDSAESDIYAFACDRGQEPRIIAVAGQVVRRFEPKAGGEMSMLATDLPLWKGDSGGAVIAKDGKLIGIFTAISRSFITFKVSRLVSVPDIDHVRSILEQDRLKPEMPNTY